jgi:hypothetical protein
VSRSRVFIAALSGGVDSNQIGDETMNRELGVWKAEEPTDRTSMNAFDDDRFRDAVEATGRKRLIMGAGN